MSLGTFPWSENVPGYLDMSPRTLPWSEVESWQRSRDEEEHLFWECGATTLSRLSQTG